MKLKIILAFLVLSLESSCYYATNFTMISTKKVDITNGGELRKENKQIVGKDVKHIYFVVPNGVPSIQDAVENALAQKPGAVALSNVIVRFKWWYIPYVYGKQWYEVEGFPLVDRSVYGKQKYIY